MRPDSRSVSFTFHREALTERNSPQTEKIHKNFRQRLQDRFDKEKSIKDKSTDSKNKSWNNISLSNVSADSRRVLRHGAEKLQKTITSVRTTFGAFSQKFKSSTRRRQILDEQQSPSCHFQTPQTRSRNLLGRTPTKLYSPFGFESPKHAWMIESNKNIPYKSCKSFRFIKNRDFAALG